MRAWDDDRGKHFMQYIVRNPAETPQTMNSYLIVYTFLQKP